MPSSTQTNQLLETVINLYLSKENVLLNNLPFVLDAITNNNLLAEPSNDELASLQKKWTVSLNSLLLSKISTIRWCGISLIKATCESSHSLLITHAKGWSAQLLGFLAKPDADIIHKESLETLQFIFSYTHDKPELLREIAAPNMPKFTQLLIQLAQKEALLPTVLSALTASNKYFPSNSKHIAEQTLKICLSCLDGSKDLDEKTVSEAFKCMTSLYRTGVKSVMAEQWRGHLSKLIGSVHECLNTLFDTVDEETMDASVPSGYTFLPVDKDYIEAFPVLIKRIQLVQNCIGTFLGTPTCVPVTIPVVQLVDLACRIYNVFEGSLMRDYKDRNEFYNLMVCLPSLHFSTSKMLSSLLHCTGQEMLRYSKLFSKILLRLLSEYKHRKTMKLSVYKLISLCLDKCGYTFAESLAKPLSTSIIQDLQIIEHKSTGIVKTNQNKGSHKKRRTDITNSDSISSKLVSASSADVQIAALEALASFLAVFGFAIENAQRSAIDSIILKRLLQTATLSNMTDEEVTLVKIELYNSLLASVTYPIETQASVLPLASRLFTAGMNHSAHGLQVVCKKGLTICDLITHARLPPIQRALPKESSTVNMNTPIDVSTEQTHFEIPEPVINRKNQQKTVLIESDEDDNTEQPKEVQLQMVEPEKITVAVEKETIIQQNVSEPVMDMTVIKDHQSESAQVLKEQESKELKRTFEQALSNQLTAENIQAIELEKTEKTENAENTKVRVEKEVITIDEDVELDEDLSGFELPDIDMTGPDSNSEEE